MHEVHRPTLIDHFRHGHRLRLFTNQTFLGLDAQVQFQLPVDPLVVPPKAFHTAQMQETQTKAPGSSAQVFLHELLDFTHDTGAERYDG